MGSQNSFYYFVIWLIKCNDFDYYEKTDNHFVSYNNKILQKPRCQLKILWRMQFFCAFCLTCTKINPFNRKKNIIFFSRICRFFVCTNYFCKHMMCIGIKIFIFEEELYHIWMNHCEHEIHHLTTIFRRNISYFVGDIWCSHRRFKNAVLPVFNASIQFNFSWFLIKWYVLA